MARFRGAQVRLSELARLKGEAEECEAEMLRLTKEVEEKKKAEEEAGDTLNEVKERQSTVAELQEGAKEAERIHREAQALAEITRDLRGKLPAGRSADAVRSLADTRDDLKHKQEQRDELREQIEEGQAKLSKIVAKDQRLQSELVSKQGQLLAAEKGAQDMRDLTQQVEGLDKQLHEATDALAQADEEKKPLQSAVASKEKELKAALKTAEHEEKRTRQRQERMASELKSLSSYHKQVEAYTRSDSATQRQELEEERTHAEQEIGRVEEAQKTAEESLEECRAMLANVEELKRSMADNLNYRRLRDTVGELQEQVDGLKADRAQRLGESAGELGEGGAKAALDEAAREFEDRQRKIERHKGGMAAFKEQKKECERQLRSKDYKHVEDDHKKALIEHETTCMAMDDLDRYYKALDKALMQYHSLKIQDINAIIRELWQLTYKGGDIDTIEIRSDVDEKAVAKGKRSYNYRVSMTKGDSELDMRGRCSAGQKVYNIQCSEIFTLRIDKLHTET
jgi:DNA repair protein RAD50